MSTYAYREALDRAQQLTIDEQLRLIEELIALLRARQTAPEPQHSILELEGLGKEVWEGMISRSTSMKRGIYGLDRRSAGKNSWPGYITVH